MDGILFQNVIWELSSVATVGLFELGNGWFKKQHSSTCGGSGDQQDVQGDTFIVKDHDAETDTVNDETTTAQAEEFDKAIPLHYSTWNGSGDQPDVQGDTFILKDQDAETATVNEETTNAQAVEFDKVSLYQILGVEKSASQDEMKRNFHKLAKRYHPDKCQNDPEAAKKIRALIKAYAILSDPRKHRYYNDFGFLYLKLIDKYGEEISE